MPRTSPDDFHQKSFRIKHEDDKFFTRLLSKETSKSYPSFRVYYGDVSSAVPFTWETRPGTPKHPSCPHSDNPFPPLTPPPSYYVTNSRTSSGKQPRSKLLLHTLLTRMNPNRSKNSGAPSSSLSASSSFSSLSWSSSSRSLFSDPPTTTTTVARRRFVSWGSSFDHGPVAVDQQDCPSGVCFGIGKEKRDKLRGASYPVLIMKKAFLSIIGHRSSE